jgi:hypothetical protein
MLFPGMLHSPPSFEVCEPLLARISRCVQEISALLVNNIHARISFLMLLDAAHGPPSPRSASGHTPTPLQRWAHQLLHGSGETRPDRG